MTIIYKASYNRVRLGATTLVLCVCMSGCASRPSTVESPAPAAVEDDASVAAVSVAPPDAPLESPPAVSEAGEEFPGVAPVQSDAGVPENIEPVTEKKQQPQYDPDDVIWIQQRLKDLGYYQGAVDGSAGKATRNAVMEYQRDQDVTADGKPTAELRKFMWLNGG